MTLCLSLSAQAQNVLILSTNEGANNPFELAAAVNQFQNAGANVNHLMILGTQDAVTPATFSQAPGPYDIVVIASVYNPIHASNWAAINEAIENRRSNAFLLFIDGCPQCSLTTNAGILANTISAAAPFTVTLGNSAAAYLSMPLNTSSPYAGSFSQLNPFQVGHITYLDGVPRDNALYLAPGATIPPTDAVLDDVFGLLIPRSESYAGNGACVFATVDMTLFTQANGGRIAPVFIHAATQPEGACGTPARVRKAFSSTQVSTTTPGANQTQLTITVDNFTDAQIDAVSVTDNLPSPLLVSGGYSSNCLGGTATAAGNVLALDNFSVPANSACTITATVQWPTAAACEDTTITNVITPGTQFTTPVGQVFTPATAELTCTAAGAVAPAPAPAQMVPATRTEMLLALMALMALLGVFARSRMP